MKSSPQDVCQPWKASEKIVKYLPDFISFLIVMGYNGNDKQKNFYGGNTYVSFSERNVR